MDTVPPDHYFRRALPHYHPDDSPYFVTYRLKHTISQVEHTRLQATIPAHSDSDVEHAKHFQAIDFILDAARHGPKYLRQPEVMDVVRKSFEYASEQWLDMIAYSIMPNHVHFVAHLKGEKSLSEVMQSLKGFTSREINRILDRTGQPLWQSEYYDRAVRKGRLGNTVYYILQNPVKAGLVSKWYDWPGTFLSTNFDGLETLGLEIRPSGL